MTAADFIKEFGLLADAPNGVQKVREMILQLAVQGKLVPQDPNDEPASVLLDKIVTEKAGLIKEGKIRKGKPLPPSNHADVPQKRFKAGHFADVDDVLSGCRVESGLKVGIKVEIVEAFDSQVDRVDIGDEFFGPCNLDPASSKLHRVGPSNRECPSFTSSQVVCS